MKASLTTLLLAFATVAVASPVLVNRSPQNAANTTIPTAAPAVAATPAPVAPAPAPVAPAAATPVAPAPSAFTTLVPPAGPAKVAPPAGATVFPGTNLQCSKFVTVQAGDTCDAIDTQNNLLLQQLIALNTMINAQCTNLSVGSALCVASA